MAQKKNKPLEGKESFEEKTTIGAELKRKRLEKKLTLEQVHKKTKIHPRILRYLEEDNLASINPVHARGFLKLYSRLLGIDADKFNEEKQEQAKASEETTQALKSSALSEFKGQISSWQITGNKKFKIALTVILCFLLGLAIFKLTQRKGEKKVISSGKQKIAQSEVIKVNKPVGSIKVTVRAKQDCWIKAIVDGKIVFQSTLKQGRFESWKAEKEITLSLGNAGGIELEVNGQLFSPLGRQGQVIRSVLINRQGLKILK